MRYYIGALAILSLVACKTHKPASLAGNADAKPELLVYKRQDMANATAVLSLASPEVDSIKTTICQGDACQEEVHLSEQFYLTFPQAGSYTVTISSCTTTACSVAENWTVEQTSAFSSQQQTAHQDLVKVQKEIETIAQRLGRSFQGQTVSDDPDLSRALLQLGALSPAKLAMVFSDPIYLSRFFTALQAKDQGLNLLDNNAKITKAPADMPFIAEVAGLGGNEELITIKQKADRLTMELDVVKGKIAEVSDWIIEAAQSMVSGQDFAQFHGMNDIELRSALESHASVISALDRQIPKLMGEVDALKQAIETGTDHLEMIDNRMQELEARQTILSKDSTMTRQLQRWGVGNQADLNARRDVKRDLGIKSSQEALAAVRKGIEVQEKEWDSVHSKLEGDRILVNQANTDLANMAKVHEDAVGTSKVIVARLLESEYQGMINEARDVTLKELHNKRRSLESELDILAQNKAWIEGGKVGVQPGLDIKVAPVEVRPDVPAPGTFKRLKMLFGLRLAGQDPSLEDDVAALQDKVLRAKILQRTLFLNK